MHAGRGGQYPERLPPADFLCQQGSNFGYRYAFPPFA
jgi:hypothetical protein